MLKKALKNKFWKNHIIGNTYTLTFKNGNTSSGWKVVYYPLFGSWEKGGKWYEYDEPRACIEKPIEGGIDFKEVNIKFLINENKKDNKWLEKYYIVLNYIKKILKGIK